MAARGMSPMSSLIQSSIGTLAGVVFFDQNWKKIDRLRSAGQYVTRWRYVQSVLWVSVVVFGIWNLWKSWQRYHADKG
jgi:hypothetical protein